MQVGLYYNKINGEWAYSGFQKQSRTPASKLRKIADTFIENFSFDIEDGLDEFYTGTSAKVVVHVNITEDGKDITSKEVEIEEVKE